MSTDVTKRLAQYVVDTDYSSLPETVIHHCKRSLMDYLSVAILGASQPEPRVLLDYFAESGDRGRCSVIGSRLRLSAANSAFVNGCSTHSLDFDDGHRRGSIHVETVILPVALALAQQYQASPEQIISAVTVGYDVMIRISMAMHPHALNRGFHNTPVAGVFGAAACGAKLLGLDVDQTINALGLAGSFSGGLYAYMQNGSDNKRLHPGKAARDGMICAELAKRGFIGPPHIFTGDNGFINAIPGQADCDLMLKGLGQVYEICNIYQKPYPCCRHLHGPMDCLRGIKREHPEIADPQQIKEIRVGTYPIAMKHAGREHHNLLEVQMSLPCALVLSLLDDTVTLDSFAPRRFEEDARAISLLDKVRMAVDEDCERSYPQIRPVKIWVELTDGHVFYQKLDNPRGGAEFPLTDAELEEKLIDNCRAFIGDTACNALIRQVWSLETLRPDQLEFIYSGGAENTGR